MTINFIYILNHNQSNVTMIDVYYFQELHNFSSYVYFDYFLFISIYGVRCKPNSSSCMQMPVVPTSFAGKTVLLPYQ